jgi:hypothetical protein
MKPVERGLNSDEKVIDEEGRKFDSTWIFATRPFLAANHVSATQPK